MSRTPYNDNNIFARILRGELGADIVYEDDLTLVFRDKFPQASVHLLVIPKSPHISFDDFSRNAPAEEIAHFFKIVNECARKVGLSGDGYRIVSNIGKNSGQEVPHFHVHILGGQPLGPILSQFD